MRLRVLALAPALVLLAACEGGDGGTAGARSQVDWNYLRSHHANTLANTSCLSDATTSAVDCNRERHEGLTALRTDAERLPESASRRDMLGSIDRWQEKYAGYTGDDCVGPSGTQGVTCALDESLLNMTMVNIESIAKKSAS